MSSESNNSSFYDYKHPFLLVFLAVCIAVARFFIPAHPLSPHGSYEAFAHLFVGGLIGAWLVSRRWLYLWLVIVLSAVELVAFFWLRGIVS